LTDCYVTYASFSPEHACQASTASLFAGWVDPDPRLVGSPVLAPITILTSGLAAARSTEPPIRMAKF
jgi:hypothetical protein